MFKNINQCDVYVCMWCIYMLQEVLYSRGIINQLLQLVMLIWGIFAFLKYIIQTTEYSPILKATILLIAMYTIYGGIHFLMQDKYYYLQISLNSLVPIFLFYCFAMESKLTSDRIRIYLPVLIVISILLYYKEESSVLLNVNKEEITNNTGYIFVTLIPCLFFYSKKPILQYIFLGIILVHVFMAMKRGAILIGALSTIVLLYANVNHSYRGTKFLFVVLSIIIVFGISEYVDYMMNNSLYFMERVEDTMEGNSSGRDVIYESLWNILLSEPNPFYFYLGRGAESTLKLIGKLAHQDWLETFCNNGLLGVFILLTFFYIFGKNAWESRYCFSRMMFFSFVTLFITTFSKTLFSMSIQNLDLPITMLLGYFAYWSMQPIEEFEDIEEIYYEQDE